MSEKKTESTEQKAEARKANNGRLWLMISFVFSGIIMTWALSLPFRSKALTFEEGSPESIAQQHSRNIWLDRRSERAQSEAQAIRDQAIAMDQEFMRQRRERLRPRVVPGKVEVQQHWDRHVELVDKQLKMLGDPEEGTLQWDAKQDLLESLEDAPL